MWTSSNTLLTATGQFVTMMMMTTAAAATTIVIFLAYC
jgi:hypothetical protein